MRVAILAAASLIAFSGCAGKADPPDAAPANVAAAAGDGVVLLTWDPLPDLIYWIFYRPGNTVNVAESNAIVLKNAVTPRPIIGLAPDTEYAFIMNATQKDSAAGPSSPIVTAKTRLAGDSWTTGGTPIAAPTLAPTNLNALAFSGATRYVTVGDGTAIFAGDFTYGNISPTGPKPLGVSVWTPANSLPNGLTGDFKSVIYNGAFVALASNGVVVSSGDGITWTQNAAVPATGMNGIAFGFIFNNATYFAVGDGGQIFISNDLITWRAVTSNTLENLTSINILNGFVVATGTNGTLLFSGDGGTTWTPQTTGLPPGTTLRSAAFMPNAPSGAFSYVAVGDGGAITTTALVVRDASNNSTGTWTPNVLAGGQNLRSVTVGGATGLRFMAVGLAGVAVFGDSVVNNNPVTNIQWTPASQPPTGDFSAVHFFTGQYLGVGAAGANAISH